MSFKIYYINRYNSQKREPRENSGYEQIVKYSNLFKKIKGNKWMGIFLFKFLKIEKPLHYFKLTASEEIILFFKALITGNPVFYLYADKDAYILPLLKRKFNLKRIKLFGTLHWPEETSQEFSFYKYNLANQFNGIIALSSSLYCENSITSCVIPHGVDTDYWEQNKALQKNNTFLLLGVSNRNHSGQIDLIMKLKKVDPNAKFILLMGNKNIYSLYKDVPDIEIIKKRISDFDLKKLYAKSKGVILFQNYSLASNVILECISTHTPLILNKVGDVEEYLGKEYRLYLNVENEETQLFNLCYSQEFNEEIGSYLSTLKEGFKWQPIANKTIAFIKNNS